MDYIARRRRRLSRCIRDEKLDALLITSPTNVTYLSGFSGESSYLLLDRKRPLLISDARFAAQIGEECPGLDAHIRPPEKTLTQATAEVLQQARLGTVGFESGDMSVAELETLQELAPAISWKGKPGRVEKLRACKDASEVAQIREAIGIIERAYAMFLAMLRPDDTEKELADNLELYVRRAGGVATSFPSIVAVGERAALPHAPATSKRAGDAGLILVDCGASGRFYKSDLTRVLATRKISTKLEKIYKVVLTAQERAIRAVRPGAKARDIDAEARTVITDAGFGQFFGHGLGHGIGLQIHEAPAVRQNSDAVLEPGMMITIEPGIYLPGWGGVRIEDDVLVTPDGCEVLTSVPKDPIPMVNF